MDIADSNDEIIKQLVIDEELLIFTAHGIYKVLTADEIDTENEHADTKHTYEKLFDVGTSSIIAPQYVKTTFPKSLFSPSV